MDGPLLEEGGEAEEEVLLRRVNAGVAGRKKRGQQRKLKQGGGGGSGLQRKNTIFGSRPRVERRLTSSSTARGSSRMFYRLAAIRALEVPRITQNENITFSALTRLHPNLRRRRERKRRPSAVGGGGVMGGGGDARGSGRIK